MLIRLFKILLALASGAYTVQLFSVGYTGAGIGMGWGISEGYGILGIIGLALAGGFVGAMIALIKEQVLK